MKSKRAEGEVLSILILLIIGGAIFGSHEKTDYSEFMKDCKRNNLKSFNYTTQCKINNLESFLRNESPTYISCIKYDKVKLINYCQDKWNSRKINIENSEVDK